MGRGSDILTSSQTLSKGMIMRAEILFAPLAKGPSLKEPPSSSVEHYPGPPRRFAKGVSLLCWAYNEELLVEGYLRRMVALLRECIDDFEIVFIDDCSTDRTYEIVKGLATFEIPEVRLLRNSQKLNVGYAFRRAVSEARKEFLFWQTIDWAYDIASLRAFLELLAECDVVAGVRRDPVQQRGLFVRPVEIIRKLFGIKHLTRRSDTVLKALVSLINYSLIRILFRLPLSDYQNVCFYRTSLIQSFEYESRSSFVNPEGLIKAHATGASIAEVPISFMAREAGEAKGTQFRAICASAYDVFRLWFKWVVLGCLDRSQHGEIRRLRPHEWPARIYA